MVEQCDCCAFSSYRKVDRFEISARRFRRGEAEETVSERTAATIAEDEDRPHRPVYRLQLIDGDRVVTMVTFHSAAEAVQCTTF
jgi:hypothetical protein